MNERQQAQKCVICGKVFTGYGNNADPIADGECCDKCNSDVVVPARIEQLRRARENNAEIH